ncbi:MAG: imidazole glycerol phosphate synthase subunit HisH [Candidatus Peribacteraceae bacterium]|jgi:glutamine amidotransferase|nr:imidazole glycerol phosphate synthase subunit HisH [Candidatus Peribacteraceae bacterium]|tara:strand:- start:627 stop:1184 length:558 start_codon:yes stop_codon:yes gene_type:complete
MIGIIRYSAGNTGSVQRALTRLNIPSKIIGKPVELGSVSGVIFPGAGAAGAAMKQLKKVGWPKAIRSYKKPFLGLCLGMQLLFDFSEEDETLCLGIIKGNVIGLSESLTRPHMGWNKLSSGDYAYFVHSYVCDPYDPSVVTMTTTYGGDLCAGVQQDNFFGVQWHPEKSGDVGDRYLLSFYNLCK